LADDNNGNVPRRRQCDAKPLAQPDSQLDAQPDSQLDAHADAQPNLTSHASAHSRRHEFQQCDWQSFTTAERNPRATAGPRNALAQSGQPERLGWPCYCRPDTDHRGVWRCRTRYQPAVAIGFDSAIQRDRR